MILIIIIKCFLVGLIVALSSVKSNLQAYNNDNHYHCEPYDRKAPRNLQAQGSHFLSVHDNDYHFHCQAFCL